MRVPRTVTTRPLTATRPAWMRRSASRREAIPAAARTFCRRTPRVESGVVSVVVALGLFVRRILELPTRRRVIVLLLERPDLRVRRLWVARQLRRHGSELL